MVMDYVDELSLINQVQNHVINIVRPKLFLVIPDYIAKHIARRVDLQDLQDMSRLTSIYSQVPIDLSGLPNAIVWTERFKVKALKQHLSPSIIYPEQEVLNLSHGSLINHWFKGYCPGTSASYKLMSIFNHQVQFLANNDLFNTAETCGCFADGLGGYTLLCGRIFHRAKLFFNTLFDTSNLASNGVQSYMPAMISMVPEVMCRVQHLVFTTDIESDITSMNYPDHLLKLGMRMPIIICDAESDSNTGIKSTIEMMSNLLKIAWSSQTKLFIFKTYAYHLDLLYILCTMMSQQYSSVDIVRSIFSNVANSEVYLIGRIVRVCSYVSNVTLQRHNIGEHPRMSLNCVIQPEISFSAFCDKVRAAYSQHFSKICNLVADKYTDKLELPEYTVTIIESHKQWIHVLKRESSQFVFPTHLIRHWKDEVQLVKFSDKFATRWRPSFLTVPLMRKMAIDYCLLLICSTSSPNPVSDFEYLCEHYNGLFYEAIDSSWGFCLSKKDTIYFGKNTKIIDLEHILRAQDKKYILKTAGVVHSHLRPFIRSLIPSLRYPLTPFCPMEDKWWSGINRYHLPLVYTPKHFFEVAFRNPKFVMIVPVTSDLKHLSLEELEAAAAALIYIREAMWMSPERQKEFWMLNIDCQSLIKASRLALDVA
uniref:RNA-dependent RNA polymerase n=1 Tax=Crocidura shantungensis ribovirus 9 TaxID=3139544 RepID=A0AB38ZK21_9VIRU